MKLYLLSTFALVSSLSFAAQENIADKQKFAAVLEQINKGQAKPKVVQKPALDPENDPLVSVCGGFLPDGQGWGIMDDAQMVNGNIVDRQNQQQGQAKLSYDVEAVDADGNIIKKY